jgi:hypothetical protein
MRSFFLAAALVLAGCASPQNASVSPEEGRDCFSARSVSGYEVIDEHNIRVRVGPSRSYTLNTTWNANSLDWSNALALHSDSGWICTGTVRGQVEVSGGQPPRDYPIDTVTREPDPIGQEGS